MIRIWRWGVRRMRRRWRHYAKASGQGAGLDGAVEEMGQRFARKSRKVKSQEGTVKAEGATM